MHFLIKPGLMTCLNKSFLRIQVDAEFHWTGAYVAWKTICMSWQSQVFSGTLLTCWWLCLQSLAVLMLQISRQWQQQNGTWKCIHFKSWSTPVQPIFFFFLGANFKHQSTKKHKCMPEASTSSSSNCSGIKPVFCLFSAVPWSVLHRRWNLWAFICTRAKKSPSCCKDLSRFLTK